MSLRRDLDKLRAWQQRSAQKARENGFGRGPGPSRTGPIKPVSAKRRREQRDRVEMIKRETEHAPVACERCDAAEAVDAHEVTPRSKGGSITDRSNVRFLCRPCHDWIGANPREARATGWLA